MLPFTTEAGLIVPDVFQKATIHQLTILQKEIEMINRELSLLHKQISDLYKKIEKS